VNKAPVILTYYCLMYINSSLFYSAICWCHHHHKFDETCVSCVMILFGQAQDGSPAGGELRRGDKGKKIAEYDARDLRHEDAQTLFRNAGNTISLVIQR